MIREYDSTKPYKTRLLHAIESTWDSPYSHVTRWPNQPYPIIRARHDCPLEVDHTDGIGTKGLFYTLYRNWDSVAQDALAMNLNDLLAIRATPYKLQNHLSIDNDDHEAIVGIIEALARLCKRYKIAMTGGETSIMNTLKGLDLSVTVTGFVSNLRGSMLQTGDTLIGLRSSGVHANGFTTVRKFFDGAGIIPFMTPTVIYWDKVFPHLDKINACMHIAGGGFTRIRDYMQYNQAVKINRYKQHPLFDSIYEVGSARNIIAYGKEHLLTDEKMYSTFNCGMGMILSVPPENVDSVLEIEGSEVIGSVVPGDGDIAIDSTFSDEMLTYTKNRTWTK